MPHPSDMELGAPARQILTTLARTGEATITELVETLGVTTTAIRQQVNRLVADGWLACGKRRGGPGRPADVFALTEQARLRFGQSAESLCHMLLNEVSDTLGPQETEQLLQRVSQRMAEDLKRRIGDEETPSFATVAAKLNEQGVLAESDNGTRLTVFTCPFPDLAPDHPEVCEMERAAISSLVGGPVRLQCCRSEGQHRCDFFVEKPKADASKPEPAVGWKE